MSREIDISAVMNAKKKNATFQKVFLGNAYKSKILDGPLLVIGLGGSGYNAMKCAKKKIYNSFYANKNGDLNGVEFLQIDTDGSDRNRSVMSHDLSELQYNEFQIFQNADIGAILRAYRSGKTEVLPYEITEWLDKDLPVAQIVHGAAGIRQAGRLLFHLNSTAIREKIEKKLKKIMVNNPLSQNRINVAIFAGIGGGTGSGTFIDAAYMVRQLIEDHSGQANIIGVVLMPDLLSENDAIDPITQNNIRRNGFAALKELDHLMNLAETKDSFSQKFPDGFEIKETEEAIFEECMLISVMGEGRLVRDKAEEHAYDVAAEMLVDMLSGSTGNSSKSNQNSMADTCLDNMIERRPVNYKYTAVGGKAVYLDFDMLFNEFIRLVLLQTVEKADSVEIKDEVNAVFDQNLRDIIKDLGDAGARTDFDNKTPIYTPNLTAPRTDSEIDRKYLHFNLERDENKSFQKEVEGDVKNLCNAVRRQIDKSIEALDREHPVDVNGFFLEAFKNLLNEQLTYCTASDADKNKAEKTADEIERNVRKYAEEKIQPTKKTFFKFKTPAFICGVAKFFFHKDLLSSGPSNEMRDELSKTVERINAINAQEQKLIYDKIYEEHISGLKRYADKKCIKSSQEETLSYEQISFQNKLWDKVYATWNDILEKRYESLEDYDLSEDTNSIFSVLDGDCKHVLLKQFLNAFDDLVKNEYRENLSEAFKELYHDVRNPDNKKIWCGQDTESIDVRTAKICEKHFNELMEKLSLDTLLREVIPRDEKSLEDNWTLILKNLKKQSEVLYAHSSEEDGEVVTRPVIEIVSIPKGAAVLGKVCKHEGNYGYINIKNRIFCMKYVLCEKLENYVYFKKIEEAYEKTNSRRGLHLYQKADILDWGTLPSPAYLDISGNSRITCKNEIHYGEIFNIAMKIGLIDKQNEQFVIRMGCMVHRDDGWHFTEDFRKIYRDVEKETDEKKRAELLAGISSSNRDVLISSVQYYMKAWKNPEEYTTYCQNWFVRMYKYRDIVKEALENEKVSIGTSK